MASGSYLDPETVWVGNVPTGYGEDDVRQHLKRFNLPEPYAIKVCQSYRDNQFAFLYYRCRRTVSRVLASGPSAIVWE